MGNPVVHFEIVGTAPAALRGFYGDLFGWEFDTSSPSVVPEVSAQGQYGFTYPTDGSGGPAIPGGVAGGEGFRPHVVFYVGVPDVGAALRQAESLGGKRVMGPERAGSDLVVAHFTDPEGNLIGLAGPT